MHQSNHLLEYDWRCPVDVWESFNFFNLGVKRQQTNNSQKDSYSIITFISPKILESIKSTKKARSLGHWDRSYPHGSNSTYKQDIILDFFQIWKAGCLKGVITYLSIDMHYTWIKNRYGLGIGVLHVYEMTLITSNKCMQFQYLFIACLYIPFILPFI